MLIPLRHEQMSARRWPVITFALIAINVVVFLLTFSSIEEQSAKLGETKTHLLILAASHPTVKVPETVEPFVTAFQKNNPGVWKQIQDPNREIVDTWDARMRVLDEPEIWQQEMDSLAAEFTQESASSITEQYAFIPSNPKPLAYLTANFLHGGWLHLIGNMWFLWLAGFVLEDAWGRFTYGTFYLIAGAAALQFYAWTNPGSMTPTLGASGAVAALMGAFLVRFPKLRIEMAWLFGFRLYRFKMAAYWLLPLWLAMEVFYGSLLGTMGGVAHWAHVGGFVFGALSAMLIKVSGLETKLNEAVEAEVSLNAAPEIAEAEELIHANRTDEAVEVLTKFIGTNASSLEAWTLLQAAYLRKGDTAGLQQASAKVCELHMRARENEAAWANYEDFLKMPGARMPAQVWLDLCRTAESLELFDRAATEYEQLAQAYPTERQALHAQLGAARVCLKKLNRPNDALRLYSAASASPIPHLDWEQAIAAGIREAKNMMSAGAGR